MKLRRREYPFVGTLHLFATMLQRSPFFSIAGPTNTRSHSNNSARSGGKVFNKTWRGTRIAHRVFETFAWTIHRLIARLSWKRQPPRSISRSIMRRSRTHFGLKWEQGDGLAKTTQERIHWPTYRAISDDLPFKGHHERMGAHSNEKTHLHQRIKDTCPKPLGETDKTTSVDRR